MRKGTVGWAAAAVLASWSLAPAAIRAGDAPPPAANPPAPPPASNGGEDEPDLKGDAKEKHDKEVKAILEQLRGEKNQEIVRGTIQRLGSSATRSGRDALMIYATGNKNQEFVKEAFNALAKIAGKKSVEFLCGKEALKSGNFLVQQSAADALAVAKSPLAVGPLLDVLTDPRTKIEITGSVSQAVAKTAPKDERVVETLFKLADAVKDTIRANATEALGFLQIDKAMEKLKSALETDKNTRVRGAAAIGMRNSKRKDAIPVLEKAMANEKSLSVKDEIQKALTELSK